MSHRLQVLIPEELDACIRKAAQRKRLSIGAWVRQAIERAVAAENEDGTGHAADSLSQLADLGAPTGDIEQMLEEIDSGRT